MGTIQSMSRNKAETDLVFTKTAINTTLTKPTHKRGQSLHFSKTGKITRHSTRTTDLTKNSKEPKEVRMSMLTYLLA